MMESRAAAAFEALKSLLDANGKRHWIREGSPTDDAPHPLWAHLVPPALRAFVARCGYPSILAPGLQLAFVPLHLQPTIGLAEAGFDWHLYKALLQAAVRRANGAFFAGSDLSDVGGWCLRLDGEEPRVWEIEESLALSQKKPASFDDWCIARIEKVRRKALAAGTGAKKPRKQNASDPADELSLYAGSASYYPTAVTPDARWPNGKVKSEGAFKDDKPEGPFRFFFMTGAPLASGHFENGVRQGTWQYHLPPSHTEDASEKRLWGRGEVKDGLEEGLWTGTDEWSPVERARVFHAGVLQELSAPPTR
ncbi:toxin-antitoxin system YwqK family antitoxin [Corallococcus sp. Z5C101001]|uniref:toxin-antitoxin system YwqK family antitoxin n=1 Tax=Corallococcus sp. Z5C101001 TaxID=2596829 RepID=UPI00117C32DA|nr:hypothetical protein [Corallococcus sp. Z5C101001]TSC25290.1 hypothetical protein FOF48_25525 [Corallococcus sp. Z5C101001]